MDAVSDDLLKPLGLPEPAEPRRIARAFPALPVAAGLLGAGLLALVAFVTLSDDPRGGEPAATVAIAARAPDPPASPRSAEPGPAPAVPGGRVTAADLEGSSGVAVVRPAGPGAPSEAVIIRLPDAPGALAAAPDPRLVEGTRQGPVPRRGKDGSRALAVYARPPGPGGGGAAQPRIALVVTGLGISQAATADAVAKLPGPVSLAFAPYGAELERHVGRAREAGHEVMLQAPMEPFDYPDNDPGPHTLLTDAKAAETADRLHWIMSRFTGYIGVVNFMGAKLMANEAALSTLLRELGARGLGFVDDGSSPRSLASTVGAKVGTPTVRADAVVDAVARGDAVERELARLETLAKTKGVAVGSASALPATVERLSRWAAGLQAKGIRLVPVSSVLLADSER